MTAVAPWGFAALLLPVVTWTALLQFFTSHLLADATGPPTEPAILAKLLQDCYNNNDWPPGAAATSTPPPPPPPADFSSFLDGKKVNLHLERVWWSTKDSDLPLTVFTMASLDRLSQLEAQCRSYPGPLSAAIYLPLLMPPSTDSGAGPSSSSLRRRRRRQRQHAGAAAGSLTEGGEKAANTSRLVAWAADRLQDLFDRLEALGPSACSPVLALYSEALSDPALGVIMPTNAMRNAALLAARTPLVAMLDADLSLSAGVGLLAANSSRVSELLEGSRQRRVLWVLPAWQTRSDLDPEIANLVVDAALAGDKTSLEGFWRLPLEAVHLPPYGELDRGAAGHANNDHHSDDEAKDSADSGSSCGDSGSGGDTTSGGHCSSASNDHGRLAGVKVGTVGQRRLRSIWSSFGIAKMPSADTLGPLHPFDVHTCQECHGATDYERFFASDEPYQVSYITGYEPWFITARYMPYWYDERFRGWYSDKQSQVLPSARRGFRLWVLPDAWVVHRPHPLVAVRVMHKKEAGGSQRDVGVLSERMVRRLLPRTKFEHYMVRTKNLWHQEHRSLIWHTYQPQVGDPVTRCRVALPWWRPEAVSEPAAGRGSRD